MDRDNSLVHVAITRRVRPGCEAEFQDGLREMFQCSFTDKRVLGASMITPPPGSETREYGILRTFASEADRDAFYVSPLYLHWSEQASRLTEGEPVRRHLHGLEAWFRSSHSPPPRWKMAVASLLGVFPTSLFLGQTLGPLMRGWPVAVGVLVFSAVMIGMLTWAVMPLVTRVLHSWLHKESTST